MGEATCLSSGIELGRAPRPPTPSARPFPGSGGLLISLMQTPPVEKDQLPWLPLLSSCCLYLSRELGGGGNQRDPYSPAILIPQGLA